MAAAPRASRAVWLAAALTGSQHLAKQHVWTPALDAAERVATPLQPVNSLSMTRANRFTLRTNDFSR